MILRVFLGTFLDIHNENGQMTRPPHYMIDYLQELLSQSLEKRSPFSAWGGKRSTEDFSRNIRGPGNSFSAWGGKRSGSSGTNEFDDRIRRELYARAAKQVAQRASQPKYRRAAFSAWGGK